MKHFISVFVALWMVVGTASAQGETATGHAATGDAAASGTAASDAQAATEQEAPAEKEKKKIYQKKVAGLLWVEFGAGPSSYVPEKFISIGGGSSNLLRGKGPQYAIAGGVQFGGFKVGIRWKWANYDTYQLMGLGVDLVGDMKFVPYVHPILGVTLNYNSLRGVPNAKGDGGGITTTVGIRVPIIRWISFFTTFNWSLVGLYIRGTGITSEGILGQQLDGQFGLTFHFIGN